MKGNLSSDFVDNSIHFIKPAKGHWKYILLNLLLRITVKWRHGKEVNINAVRKQINNLNRQSPKNINGIERNNLDFNGTLHEWLTPKYFRNNQIILYIHGGAFIASSPNIYANMVSSWCQSLHARALMVNYRLAPEHPYPAASDDCIHAYQWLLDQGYKANDIVIAGDSAGGNLALSTLMRIKEEHIEMPACAVMLSPFLDFTLSGKSALTNAKCDPTFTHSFAIDIRKHYVSAELQCDPKVSPLFGDFSDLPPLLFQVGSTEMLLDDSVRAATKAKENDIPVQLDIWESMPHVFQTIGALPQAKIAAQRIFSFINLHTNWNK